MFFPSSRNKSGLTGRKATEGDAIGHAGQWLWNLHEKGRSMGVPDDKLDEFMGAVKGKKADKLEPFSGIILAPKNGKGEPLGKDKKTGEDITVPLEFGGRTYQVGDEGIKIVNEKILDEIVTESIEREEYVTDVCEMFLYAGDAAVAVVSSALHTALKTGECLPSQIRHEPDPSKYGGKYLAMKIEVEKVIDKIVIPEETLEKARKVSKEKREFKANRLRTEAEAS